MNQKERQESILNKIKIQESVTTNELVEEFKVSIMTIRRDLHLLEESGYIILNHGGAVLKKDGHLEHSMMYKQSQFVNEKKSIAKYCASLVNDDETIFIETGTTAQAVANELTKKKNLKVHTNSLSVINTLSRFSNIELFVVPGKYRELSDGFVGPLTNQYIQQFYFDYAFIGTEGIDLKYGLTAPDLDDALTKKSVVEQSKSVIIVADHTKFNNVFTHQVCKLNQVTCVVTDEHLDEVILDEYQGLGVEVVKTD